MSLLPVATTGIDIQHRLSHYQVNYYRDFHWLLLATSVCIQSVTVHICSPLLPTSDGCTSVTYQDTSVGHFKDLGSASFSGLTLHPIVVQFCDGRVDLVQSKNV